MNKILSQFFALGLATCISTQVHAAGFYIQEQSVSGLGNAFAGATAMPRDASIIYYNPAGMTYLEGRQGNIGVHFLSVHSDTDDTGTSAVAGGLALGGDTDNPYDLAAVPNLNYSHQLNDRFWAGVAVTAPFGLKNEYDEDWFGRFDSTSSDLMTINVQPSVAVKLTDDLSFGAGIDIQYVDAELKSARYVGGGAALEGVSTLEGDDISYGYNLGFMYDVSDDTRLGIHYRSQVNHKLDGEISLEGSAADFTAPGKANLNLPDMLSLGVTHDLNDQWTIMGGAMWFGWSNYERITAITDAGVVTQDQAQNYKNTWAVNVGGDYKYSDEWTFRGGIQYDETPTQDGFRSTRTPDGDRIWLSGGATYTMSDKMSWDFAVTYINVSEEDITLSRNTPPAGTVSNIEAENNGHVGIFALGLNYKF